MLRIWEINKTIKGLSAWFTWKHELFVQLLLWLCKNSMNNNISDFYVCMHGSEAQRDLSSTKIMDFKFRIAEIDFNWFVINFDKNVSMCIEIQK